MGIISRFNTVKGMRSSRERETTVKYSCILFLKPRHFAWWVVREKDWIDRIMTQAPSLGGFLTRTPSAKQQRSCGSGGSPRLQLSGHLTGSRQPAAGTTAQSPPKVPWKERVGFTQVSQPSTSFSTSSCTSYRDHSTARVNSWARSRPNPLNYPWVLG